ncbi:MAG: 2,3-bisphosphoglycerate-independent phosphoglycerate mutase [Methanocella sp. PtaU1.Bin125]|nr:MAG: 2,3-bisphosphoglycerate-independent phosphoglycerate mutase [Methanocella sp. PtaU1.Bin125]
MKRYMSTALALLSLLFIIALSGCIGSNAQWSMVLNGDSRMSINESAYEDLSNCNLTVNGVNGIPLEFFLYDYGLYPLVSVSLDGKEYNWSQVTYAAELDVPFLVLPNGSVYDGESVLRVSNINVTLSEKPQRTTLEIAPSVAYALGAGGSQGLIGQPADRVVVFYVDGLGYERYLEARDLGIIENITALGEPVVAVCQYPSVSQVNADSLVTGIASDIRAGNFRSYYPSGKTVLETVEDSGKTSLWVAGRSTPVNMGDLVLYLKTFDSNGYEANEVAEEAIRQYCDEDIDLLFVHFKDPDKFQHINGPFSEKGRASLEYVDEQLGRVTDVLRPGTAVVLFADHGGHNTIAGGNHGTLLSSDMIVPIVVHVV